jgi:hypothetical protein
MMAGRETPIWPRRDRASASTGPRYVGAETGKGDFQNQHVLGAGMSRQARVGRMPQELTRVAAAELQPSQFGVATKTVSASQPTSATRACDPWRAGAARDLGVSGKVRPAVSCARTEISARSAHQSVFGARPVSLVHVAVDAAVRGFPASCAFNPKPFENSAVFRCLGGAETLARNS